MLFAVLRRFERALFLHGPDLSENADELQLVRAGCHKDIAQPFPL